MMNTVEQSRNESNLFLKSDLEEWCNPERLSRFLRFITPLQSTILWGNNYKSCLVGWIRREMISEFLIDNSIYQSLECNEILLANKKDWDDKKTIYQSFSKEILDNELNNFLLSEFILESWARKEWGHRLEAQYLEKKHQLDRITCSVLRVSDKHLAAELYYRLKSDGVSFEELSWKFGQGAEKRFGGKFSLQRMQDLPNGFSNYLRKIKPGEVLKPHLIGKYYVIIQLDELIPAQFDEETKKYLLTSELNVWLNALGARLSSEL